MSRFCFAIGAQFIQDGRVHRFSEKVVVDGNAGWLVTRLDTGEMATRKQEDLERAYAFGSLVRYNDPGELSGLARTEHERRAKKHYDDLSDAERRRLDGRRALMKYVESRIVVGAKTTKLREPALGGPRTVLEQLLKDGAAHAGLATVPSAATYYRWKQNYDAQDTRALVGRFSERGDRSQLHPLVRQTVMGAFQRELDDAIAATRAGKFVRLAMKDLLPKVEQALNSARIIHAGIDLQTPSRATLYNWWAELPAVKRDTVNLGIVKARQSYRFIRGHDGPEQALDEVEYDESDLPFFFYDEDTLVPLGRGTLSWFLDVFCHSVNGFYLGFEPGGDLPMVSAAKHMCLPKAYVGDEYQGITNRYLQHGIPRLIRVDNSRTAWGRTAEELSHRLDCDWDWCPSRTPCFKAIVEGMFRLLNEDLISSLPGNVTARLRGRADYDPTKNGVIGMRQFLFIFHKWLVDVYHPARQTRLGASPNERFVSGTLKIPPGLLDRATDIRMMFAIVREGRLDHKGVVFQNLPYGGDELQQLRLRLGHTQKVRVKVDPSDLQYLWVWDTKNKAWISAASRRPEYTRGLSLHQHTLIGKHELSLYGTVGEKLPEARAQLQALIGSAAGDALSIRRSKLAARFEGIGTDNIFANLDHDGRLGPMAGPFTGLRLDPLPPPERGTTATVPGDMLRIPDPDAAPFTADGAASDTPAPSPEPRRRKRLAGDRSLGADQHGSRRGWRRP